MDLDKAKADVAYFMRRTYQRSLTTSTGGNISQRYNSYMLITSSGKDKSSLEKEDIAVVDIDTGKNLTPGLRLSIESNMHRKLYIQRHDIGAIVHSHPTFCCLYSASDNPINTALIAESWYLLDKIEKIPYKRMGTDELAECVSSYMKEANAALLENHGAITLGKDLLSAFDRMECLEQAAKMTLFSSITNAKPLNESKIEEISRMR